MLLALTMLMCFSTTASFFNLSASVVIIDEKDEVDCEVTIWRLTILYFVAEIVKNRDATRRDIVIIRE